MTFYCGIASNLDDLFPLFDNTFLLKTSKKVLRERLTTRTSNDFARTPETQKQLFSWKKWWENRIREKGAIVINANNNLKEIVKEIIKKSQS